MTPVIFLFFLPPRSTNKVGQLQHKTWTNHSWFSSLEWVRVKKCSDTGFQFHMSVFTLIFAEQMLQSLVMYTSTFLFFFFCAPCWQMNTRTQKYDCWQLLWGFILQLRNKGNKLIAAKNFCFFLFLYNIVDKTLKCIVIVHRLFIFHTISCIRLDASIIKIISVNQAKEIKFVFSLKKDIL